jgi:RNA polymerase sigma-70 factor (sigma-E family)
MGMLSADVERIPEARTEAGRLGELYLRHADGAIRLAYLLTGDQALAEDLVQDAFVKLAGRLVHLRDLGAFDAYLRRTIVNLSNSYFRRKRVERSYLQSSRGELEAHAVVAGGERAVEDRDEVWAGLRKVSVRQRTALVLRFYEDLSEQQIADVMNCRPGTVKSLISRGLEQLRQDIPGGER